MSQEKVDKYKQEKYNRKHAKKKRNFKKVAGYVVATLVVIAFVGYVGYSVAIATGLYTPPATTVHHEMSDAEIESARNALIQNGDQNVKVTPAATENTTAATGKATTKEKATVAEETTAAK